MAGPTPSMPTPAQIKVLQIKNRVAPLLDSGQFELARTLLEEVLPLGRRDAVLHKMLGFAYANLQNTDRAGLHLKRAIELGVRDTDTHICLAGVCRDNGDTMAALRVVNTLLAGLPNDPKAINFKARMLRSMGDTDGALDLLESAREAGAWHANLSILRAEILRKFKRFDQALGEVRDLLDSPRLRENNRRDALFESGHIYDAMGDYDRAFDAFSRGNAMLDDTDLIPADEFREVWSREALEGIPRGEETSDLPVFVVGMPRSGTTLTEQILASHPKIATLGESNALTAMLHDKRPPHFDAEAVRAVAEGYFERTNLRRLGKVSRVVDKMPENYYYLGVIARALPNASIIHCTRDARDICLSCFFQNFGTRLSWTRRITTCAKQFVIYRTIMDHWAEVLDEPVLENNYERLTSDPRPHVEAMLDHISVPFDEKCMAHHKQKANVQTASVDQVRNPIYTSSQQRWKRYEKHLGPMMEILEGY